MNACKLFAHVISTTLGSVQLAATVDIVLDVLEQDAKLKNEVKKLGSGLSVVVRDM